MFIAKVATVCAVCCYKSQVERMHHLYVQKCIIKSTLCVFCYQKQKYSPHQILEKEYCIRYFQCCCGKGIHCAHSHSGQFHKTQLWLSAENTEQNENEWEEIQGHTDCPSSVTKFLSVDQYFPSGNNQRVSSDGPSCEHDASDDDGEQQMREKMQSFPF